MADRVGLQQALKGFSDQASADLAAAKGRQATAAAALEAATLEVVGAEADLLLGKATGDVMAGASVVANAVTKAEADPATKWYVRGAILLVAVGVAFAVYAGVHHA